MTLRWAALVLLAACEGGGLVRVDRIVTLDSLTQVASQSPREIVAADVTSDGVLDIGVAGVGGLTLLAGAATDSFRPEHTGFGAAVSIVAADLDGDGKPELAVSDDLDPAVNVFTFSADTVVPQHLLLEEAQRPAALVAADVDGDGAKDLLVTDRAGGLYLLRNDGHGRFAITRSDFPTEVTSLVAGDWNSDGRVDLAASGAQSLSIFLGAGDGTFAAGPAAPALAGYLATGDFDRDGRTDLGYVSDTSVGILLSRGDGRFEEKEPLELDPPPRGIAAGDLDGDGMLDLVTTDTSGRVHVVRGARDGGLFDDSVVATGLFGLDSPFAVRGSIAIGDWNRDGIADIAIAERFGNHVAILLMR